MNSLSFSVISVSIMRIFILIDTVYFNSGSYNMIYFNIAYICIFIIVYLSSTAVLIYSAYELYDE